MKKTLYISALLAASLIQSSCDVGDGNAFGTGADNPDATGVPAIENFRVDISTSFQIEVFNPDDYSYDSSKTATLVAFAYDRNGAPVENTSVTFATEWGTFPSGTICTTDSTGSCSVDWAIGDPSAPPSDYCSRVVAYTTGEESFFDSDGDNAFDDDDVVSALPPARYTSGFIDLPDPYFDTNRDGNYTFNTDIPVGGFGTHTVADGDYNGSATCSTTNFCSTTETITIWDGNYIDLKDETTKTVPDATNTCVP